MQFIILQNRNGQIKSHLLNESWPLQPTIPSSVPCQFLPESPQWKSSPVKANI